MALTGKTVADTYKDLLTVNSAGFDGQGLESTRKRVIDGEGVNSALFLGTNDLAFSGPIIGDVNIQGALQVDGSTTLDSLVIRNNQDENNTILEHYRNNSGSVDQTRLKGIGRIYMKEHIDDSDTLTLTFTNSSLAVNTAMDIRSTLTITDPSTGNTLELDPNNKDLGGSGDTAKVSFTETEVKLAKGDTALFTAKEDGTARIKEVSSFPTSGTASGDLVNVSGVLYVNA
jgi:hypothetical protein